MNSDSSEAGASPHAAFADAGFVDTFDQAGHRSGEEYRSFNGGEIPLPRGDSRIDRVYVRNGTPVRDWTLVPQTDAPQGEPRDLLRSDHNQIHTTVRLPVVTR